MRAEQMYKGMKVKLPNPITVRRGSINFIHSELAKKGWNFDYLVVDYWNKDMPFNVGIEGPNGEMICANSFHVEDLEPYEEENIYQIY